MSEQGANQNQAVMAPDEAILWKNYLEGKDPSLRSELIVRYMPTAKHIAASMYANRPFSELEFSDYLQYARVGLIEAVDRYDPGRGASFSTYAGYRIKGSILNGIESNSELAAQCAYRRKIIRERAASLHESNDKADQEDGFASLAQTTIDLALGYVLEDKESSYPDDTPADDRLYDVCELKRIRERLVLIVEALPERERFIIKGHYFDHMEFTALASQLGLTKGRVSQLHARGLVMLREAYRALTGFDVSI